MVHEHRMVRSNVSTVNKKDTSCGEEGDEGELVIIIFGRVMAKQKN
jgi:hypothetical protein